MEDTSEQKILPRKILGKNRQVASTSKSSGDNSDGVGKSVPPQPTLTTLMDRMTLTDINPELQSGASVSHATPYNVFKGATASGSTSNKRQGVYFKDEKSACPARQSLNFGRIKTGIKDTLEQPHMDVCHNLVQITPMNISISGMLGGNKNNLCPMVAGSGVILSQDSLGRSYFKTGTYLVENLDLFLNRLMEVKSAAFFFKAEVCWIAIPDFMLKTPNFMDVGAIIEKCRKGGYSHIFEVVHDIKGIIYQARMYLKNNPNRYPNLNYAIVSFEADIKRMLAEEFKNYKFEHIKGRPHENLYDIDK